MDWLRDHLWETWLGLAILLGVAEVFSLDLILAMLAAGAIVGMVTAMLGLPVAVQILAAAATSIAAVALVRPSIVSRLKSGPELMVGHGKLVGRQGVVLETVTSHVPGRIRLAGEVWTAEPYDESLVIETGETVEVLQIRGATALVHPILGYGELGP